jgi:hypothetical protein
VCARAFVRQSLRQFVLSIGPLQLPSKLLASLCNMDENFAAWRTKHAMLECSHGSCCL